MRKTAKLSFDSLEKFESSKDIYADKFKSDGSIFKRKITQALFWTSLDKDLANQVMRDERWLFGIKFCDSVKFVNHGSDEVKSNNNNIGFKK